MPTQPPRVIHTAGKPQSVLRLAVSSTTNARFLVGARDFIARLEVFTAMTMENSVFWDTKPQFVLHKTPITSLLQSRAG
jgi:hypothetical protein